MNALKRIAIIGPESTGKSTLSQQLADHYQTLWVPEHARHYLERNGLRYNYADLLEISRQQVALEDEIASRCTNRVLFLDTNLYVMKVWCEFVFGKCHPWILDQIAIRKYDMYLLCDIDLPWEYQEMREHPDPGSRSRLFAMYKDLLVNQHVPWKMISGSNEERLLSGVRAVDMLMSATTV